MTENISEYKAGFIMGQLVGEEYLREKLAKEIEESCKGIVWQYTPCSHCQNSVDIVRGTLNDARLQL